MAEDRAKAFRNTAQGIGKLRAFLGEQGATRVVCEPTGGYERRLVRLLREAGFPVQLAHPNRVRAFARVCGYEAKTDLLDAQVLARYGRMFPEPEAQPAEPERQGLQDLLRRRQQLVAQRVQERNRLRQDLEASVLQSTQRHIAWLDQEYQDRLRQHATLGQRAALYRTVPCPAWGQSPPPPWWPNCPSWDTGTTKPSPPWWAWPPGPETAAKGRG